MNIRELRNKLATLPKAFDEVDVGIWDEDRLESVSLGTTLVLCRNEQNMEVAFMDDDNMKRARCHIHAEKPIPSNRNELLEFLAPDMEFRPLDSDETKKKIARWLSDLRISVLLEMEEESQLHPITPKFIKRTVVNSKMTETEVAIIQYGGIADCDFDEQTIDLVFSNNRDKEELIIRLHQSYAKTIAQELKIYGKGVSD